MVQSSREAASRSRAHGFSTLSTSVGVALTLIVLGALMALAMVVKDLRTEWLSSLRIEVALERGTEGTAADWESRWSEDNAVQSARFISADSAGAELERELGEPFMDFLGTAPLPAMVELSLNPAWMGASGTRGLAEAAQRWEQIPGVARVTYPKRILERLDRGFSDWTLPAVVAALLLIALVVAQISNVVRLSVFGRRHLIRSMELVGAPRSSIRRPFLAEAMGYGVVGALLAYAAVVGMLGGLKPFLGVLQGWTAAHLLPILGAQLTLGLAITGMSARWAVGRYLGASLDRLM